VRVVVTPARAASQIELQRYVRERFDYLRLRRLPTGPGGRAVFRLRSTARLRLRAAVVKPAPGWAPAAGAAVTIERSGP
jgi:hypothetical protein